MALETLVRREGRRHLSLNANSGALECRIAPKLSDAELVTLAVIEALLGYTSEARFIRYAHTHLRPWFP